MTFIDGLFIVKNSVEALREELVEERLVRDERRVVVLVGR
jgi:hypothetical protein